MLVVGSGSVLAMVWGGGGHMMKTEGTTILESLRADEGMLQQGKRARQIGFWVGVPTTKKGTTQMHVYAGAILNSCTFH